MFSSPSPDFRFLGGYLKDISEDDIKAGEAGGMPIASVVLLVGYGAAPTNVLSVGKRLILNNGFHRAYALRSIGYTFMPAVVQRVTHPDLELGQVINGLPKEYLIGSPRPSMVKDFFDERLVTKLRVKARLRTIKVAWGAEQLSVPT